MWARKEGHTRGPIGGMRNGQQQLDWTGRDVTGQALPALLCMFPHDLLSIDFSF